MQQVVTRFPLAPGSGNWAELSVTRLPLTEAEYRQLRAVLEVVIAVLQPEPERSGEGVGDGEG